MLYLDTHVVVWLYEGLFENFASTTKILIENNALLISPIVSLELTYLYETKRITQKSKPIINELRSLIGLKICDMPFETIVDKAEEISWTRDPFDRCIVASAACKHSRLLTKDKIIRKHFKQAVW